MSCAGRSLAFYDDSGAVSYEAAVTRIIKVFRRL